MTGPRPRIALLGAGVMGRNHARVVTESGSAELAVVIDGDVKVADEVAQAHGCRSAASIEAAFACDAAIVATTTETHPSVVLPLLEAGLPVLVEKPVAVDIDDVRTLAEVASRKGLPLMCGFVERFNPAVRALLGQLLTETPRHIVALRHSPRTPRAAASVAHDLLIHDVDLCLRMAAPAETRGVRATSWCSRPGAVEVMDCSMRFSDGALATLSASRISQRKVRAFSIETDSLLIELDLVRNTATVYHHLGHALDPEHTYHAQTAMDVPFIRTMGEPLALQLDHFVDLINGRADAAAERRSIIPPHAVVADAVAQ